MKIILASQSPRRKKILTRAGYTFKVVSPNIDEKTLATASETVQANARLKCHAVGNTYPNFLVIAADTVVSLNEKIIEKPKNIEEASEMLKSLSNKTHQVLTAVSIRINETNIDFIEISNVQFKKINDNTIAEYFSKVNPLDKSGAYNIDEHRDLIIDHFEGEYENIMGLPIIALKKNIKHFI